MSMNVLQDYMIHEYVADYNEGHLSRRDLIRRVLNITGGLGSAATILLALGCTPTPAAHPTPAPPPPPGPPPPPAPPAPPQPPTAGAPAPPPASSPSAVVKPAASPSPAA